MKRLILFLGLWSASLSAATFRPDQIVLSWQPAPAEDIVSAEAQRLGLDPAARLGDVQQALLSPFGASPKLYLDSINVQSYFLTAGQSVTLAAASLAASPLVKYAEPNYLYFKSAVGPNDTLKNNQWYYSQIAADQAYDAWVANQIQLTSLVTVAVLDTGVEGKTGADPHAELVGQVDESNAASFVSGVGETWDNDVNGHGTFVSGLIAAKTNNSAGIAGIFFDSSKIKIMPVRVLDASGGGGLDEIAAGVLHAVNRGARVINMSLGATVNSITMENAVRLALERNVLVVAAAGNEGSFVSYPASYPDVVAVGALTNANIRAFYSNFGDLDISAPGGNAVNTCTSCSAGTPTCWTSEIISLATNDKASCAAGSNSPGTYTGGPGTSYAAPMVAAAAALLLSQDMNRSPADLIRILTQSADATAHGSGYNTQAGWGRLNVYRALTGDTFHAALKGNGLKVYNWPNPFNPKRNALTTLSFVLQQPQAAVLSIFDQGGDRVFKRELSASQTHAGLNSVTWDGHNENGRDVANGSYLLVLESGGARVNNWVAVLR